METRKFWIESMLKILDPVLYSFKNRNIRQEMPPLEKIGEDGKVYRDKENAEVAYLEALGRGIAGIAPWLELELPDGEEKALQAKYRELVRDAIDAGTAPDSPARCLWWDPSKGNEPNQPIVDAAYVALAMTRAPQQLYYTLSDRVKKNLIDCLLEVRNTRPFAFNNWVLFGAMVETALYKFTGKCDGFRIEAALARMDDWFLGDGVYGDGPHYAWDYYNSYVIHPMMEEITIEAEKTLQFQGYGEKIKKLAHDRLGRYAIGQMYQIAPDGTYPPVGRSIVYRMGAFQALAQAALKEYNLGKITPAQVRRALTSVITKFMDGKENFDEKGWLRTGLWGCQPKLRDSYNSTGSFYMASLIFLPLGLPSGSDFWTMPEDKTPWEKLWSGEDIYR